ncbi:MAG TPA: PIN domain-containing protein [Burkholderiaceae bacterium]|nr:PIN domain-containing protein [Burkholderiaceae bacterium]
MPHADLSTLPHSIDAPRLVLDTNVVLDWLLFRNPACAALDEALTTGRAIWVASIAMHDELMHVLSRGTLAAWQPDLEAIAAARERWAHTVAPGATFASPRLRCTDPDDQKFIDLALQLGTASLLSRDRAVLKLARRAREAGVAILTPEAWARQRPASH